jgi:mevalonate kinase
VGVGTARAKLLLFGEHAAVYGHPAVGLSLPWPLTVVHTPGSGWHLPGLGEHEAAVRALVDRLTDDARREGLPLPEPGRLEFTTSIPLASGFGSSGALCAALVNVFFPELPLPERDRLAWRAEAQFHGTPSGIDTALALREGWWALDTSTRPVTAAPLADPGLSLVTGSLVRVADTKALVGGLAARRAAGEPLVVDTLDELGAVARQAVAAWGTPSLDLPSLVNRARVGLRRLGLETAALTAVLEAGMACPGALAGKLSGAGGGGAFVLVFANRSSAERALPRVAASVDPGRWTAAPRLV